jgi:mannosyltransferase OCH1-like enzyme
MHSENHKLIAEDDLKRSEFIHNFFSVKNQMILTSEIKIPKVIIQYWHNLDEIPQDVANCIQSWKILKEKGFEFKLFDDSSAKKFILENFETQYLEAYLKCHHPAMRCDYFRLCYLQISGGFYVDCDEIYSNQEIDSLYLDNNLKIQPLCYSIQKDQMVDIKDYFTKPFDESNVYYFNNNPILAPPNHNLIHMALKRSTERLINDTNIFDIQSATGPGNLSASTTYYLLENQSEITIIKNWDSISVTPWPLSYRNDDRNWRLYNAKNKKWFN